MALAVILGAFGAHALKERLVEAGQLENWHTAVRYHAWHALAVLAFGIVQERRGIGSLPAWLFTIGTLLFSGSIYCLSLDVARSVMGPITPLGGLCLIVGWIVFAVQVLRGPRRSEEGAA